MFCHVTKSSATSLICSNCSAERDSSFAEQLVRVSQGFWGTREHWQNIEGNKGTLATFWEPGNKIRKIKVRKHSESVGTWEHRAILEGNKGTRTPTGRP